MGREIKRVPLDFDWPTNKVWKGFINPHFQPCPAADRNDCHGGYSNAGKWLSAVARLIALLGEQAVVEPRAEELRARGQLYPHPYLTEWPQAPRTGLPRDVLQRLHAIEDNTERMRAFDRYAAQHPARLLSFTDEMVALVTGLAGRRPDPPFGSSIEWHIESALKKAAGIDPDGRWGICKVCEGHGIDPAVREAHEAWEKEEPPAGAGWQLWETVSKGSPVSPVFPSESAFVTYLVGEGYSEKAARAFCKSGWALSMLVVSGGPAAGAYRDIEAHALDKTNDMA